LGTFGYLGSIISSLLAPPKFFSMESLEKQSIAEEGLGKEIPSLLFSLPLLLIFYNLSSVRLRIGVS
jgi:hypothetical protein